MIFLLFLTSSKNLLSQQININGNVKTISNEEISELQFQDKINRSGLYSKTVTSIARNTIR